MRRVLFLEPVAERGGAEAVLLDLLRHLDRARFEPHVALLARGPLETELAGLAAVHAFEGHRVRSLPRTLATIGRLVALARRVGADLLHTQGTKTHLYGGAVRALARVPELWHLYDPPPAAPGWIDRVVSRLPADAVVFISEAPRQGFAPLIDVSRAEVIHPGIAPLPAPEPGAAERVLARLGVPEHARVVLQVSRLQAFKGHETLVDAFARIAADFPDVHVVMAGGTLFGLEAEYPARVQARIASSGTAGRAHLAGWVSDVELRALFNRAACLCYAEHVGPYSLVILEAMAAGRPVVASATAGATLLVEEGRTGRLVPPGDAVSLASALAAVLADPDAAARMGEAGRARQAAAFTAEAMTRAVERVWDRLAGYAPAAALAGRTGA